MRDWESYIDKAIRQAMEEGQMSNLPGEGRPLRLNDDPNTPDELRMAHKILRENDLVPDWMAMSRELDEKREQILTDLRKAAQTYRSVSGDARHRQQVETRWRSTRQKLTAAADAFNKQILAYNLKVPPGIAHKFPLDIQREASRLLDNK